MTRKMKILVTNDDGYSVGAIKTLAETLRHYGNLTVIAPKSAQSGMSMAVTMGHRPIAVKCLSRSEHESWWYLDGTPASCVKFGIDNILFPEVPDVVVSGINYGSNAATAAIYSGTIGAAAEGAVNGILSIGVSLDDFSPNADFSAIQVWFPAIFEKLIDLPRARYGNYYNINFPAIPAAEIKGVRVGHMGHVHWEREYRPYDRAHFESLGEIIPAEHLRLLDEALPGEEFYVMVGDVTDNPDNDFHSDHILVRDGYISIVAHNFDNTDAGETQRLKTIFPDQ